MSEYIFDVPDSNQPIAGDTSLYYPDERDEPMIVREEIVRCRDCIHYEPDPNPIDPGWPMWCEDTGRDLVQPDGFCAWGELR